MSWVRSRTVIVPNCTAIVLKDKHFVSIQCFIFRLVAIFWKGNLETGQKKFHWYGGKVQFLGPSCVLPGLLQSHSRVRQLSSKAVHCSTVWCQGSRCCGKEDPNCHVTLSSKVTTQQGRPATRTYKRAGHLICSEIFDSVTFCFFKVGHTHCEVDQRFSVLANCLNQCTGLQTPQAWPNSETRFGVRI